VISAQCSECQREEIQASAGKGWFKQWLVFACARMGHKFPARVVSCFSVSETRPGAGHTAYTPKTRLFASCGQFAACGFIPGSLGNERRGETMMCGKACEAILGRGVRCPLTHVARLGWFQWLVFACARMGHKWGDSLRYIPSQPSCEGVQAILGRGVGPTSGV
jgi:hypothetical protein